VLLQFFSPEITDSSHSYYLSSSYVFICRTIKNGISTITGCCCCYQEDTRDFSCERNTKKEAGGKKKSM
jgi:hypothetical protein